MIKTNRKTYYQIRDVFVARRSLHAFLDEQITIDGLMELFDATQWAQNSYNNQIRRFVYAKRNSLAWQRFVNFLVPANQVWVTNAQVLVVVIPKKTFDYNGKSGRTHLFDTDAACQNMALLGVHMDILYDMEGVNYDKIKRELNVPNEYKIEIMFAIGKLGNPHALSEKLQAGKTFSDRKALSEFVFENTFLILSKK